MGLIAPLLATLAVWWISTGAIVLMGERSNGARRIAMGVASVLALIGLGGVWALRDVATPLGAYGGALAALALWAWHEMSFLFGYITGPNRAACPREVAGWARFRAAAATLIHHELALAATLVLLAVMSLGAENLIALQVFAMMFVLRISSKLNLYLGAPHFTDQFLPKRLSYLNSYFSRERAGAFFIATTLSICALSAALIWSAVQAPSPFTAAGLALLAALAALGALEHLFLALPLPDAALWRWLLPARDPRRTPDV